MRKLLNIMFGNKKLALIIPIAIALLMYLLFTLLVLVGVTEDKANLTIIMPIMSAIYFFGLFLVEFIQIKNPMCPAWFLDLFELLVSVAFVIYAIIGIVRFVVSGFQNFDAVICFGFVTYSAIAWAHSKRTK